MDNATSAVDRFTPSVKGCSFCDHPPGLAVLPVRYAVVGPEGKQGASALAGNFKIVDAPAQLGGGAQYTLRPCVRAFCTCSTKPCNTGIAISC